MSDTNSVSTASHPGGTGTIGDHSVARVGYGAMQLEHRRDDRAAAVAVIRRAIELGVDHIDTAQFYGNGFSNELIREAVRPDDGVTVVTKAGADPNPDGPMPMRAAQRPAELRASVEHNLRSLGVDQIPVVNLRRVDANAPIPVSEDQVVDFDDQLAAMVAMRDEGLIGGIGLSTVSIDMLRRALPAGIACVQNAYSLVSRTDDDMLDLCTSEGIAWVPYFPLGSAFPGMPKVTDEAIVAEVAQTLDVTPSQVGLAWLLHRAPGVLLIPGTSSVEHLEQNVAAGSVVLDADMLAALDNVPHREGQIV
ncbi:aldo/keto reductase [Gordonia hankookensis]|uniref:Aldo/keto reductase n=1 Tax=Gordonia hankookensis TaxID=589403 RepID=A0ABR7WD04_9ACTN|nr:aldo/keto reductase [Gordonia hankookensis]MBD1320520.1 aldo/keto reductase [Gordonia hankookensis]